MYNGHIGQMDYISYTRFAVIRNQVHYPGADPGFQVGGEGGAYLKQLRRAEGGAKNFGVFRVKNHDFTPKNHIFSNFRGGARLVRHPWIRPCYRYLFMYIQCDRVTLPQYELYVFNRLL